MDIPGRQPAPGSLRHIQDLLNTNDIEGAHDELSLPDEATAWLQRRGLLDTEDRLSADEHQRLIAVREALRDVLDLHRDHPLTPQVIDTLNEHAHCAPFEIRFRPDATAELLSRVRGIDGAIASLLAVVYESMLDGTWTRLKICRRRRCRAAFYDASRNRSGIWCTMAVCGSREKSASYRQRQRTEVDKSRPGRA